MIYDRYCDVWSMIYDRQSELPISLSPATPPQYKIRKVINLLVIVIKRSEKNPPFALEDGINFNKSFKMPLSISSSSPPLNHDHHHDHQHYIYPGDKVVGCEQVSVPLVVIGSTEPSLHNVSNNVWQGNIFEFAFQHRSLVWFKKTEICNPFVIPWQDKLTIETIDGKT